LGRQKRGGGKKKLVQRNGTVQSKFRRSVTFFRGKGGERESRCRIPKPLWKAHKYLEKDMFQTKKEEGGISSQSRHSRSVQTGKFVKKKRKGKRAGFSLFDFGGKFRKRALVQGGKKKKGNSRDLYSPLFRRGASTAASRKRGPNHTVYHKEERKAVRQREKPSRPEKFSNKGGG